MKVVLFCGGSGLRLHEHGEWMPKPLVPVGPRPILWNVMKYYAHHGHKDFLLCLGSGANEIKQYFLRYDECISNDFVLREGGAVGLFNTDIHDWTISFVDTGPTASVGERLLAVRPHLRGEEVFLANYTDGLTDLHLPDLVDLFERRDATAAFLSVRPRQVFHTVESDEEGRVRAFEPIARDGMWMNGGFFVFRQEIFRDLRPGEDLVEEPFQRLIARGALCTLRHRGFFGCLDTYKEKQGLDDMYERGVRPWEVWRARPAGGGKPSPRASAP